METTSEGTSTVGVFPSEAAYDQLLPEIAAVPEEDFMHINTDVPCDVTTVLGALPELKALRTTSSRNFRRSIFNVSTNWSSMLWR